MKLNITVKLRAAHPFGRLRGDEPAPIQRRGSYITCQIAIQIGYTSAATSLRVAVVYRGKTNDRLLMQY